MSNPQSPIMFAALTHEDPAAIRGLARLIKGLAVVAAVTAVVLLQGCAVSTADPGEQPGVTVEAPTTCERRPDLDSFCRDDGFTEGFYCGERGRMPARAVECFDFCR